MPRILLRRSVGRPALLAAVAVIAANTMLRKRQWVHEWLGAYFNFHFVLVFLGPLAAGLGAWEGARLARSRDLLQSSGQARRALIGAAGAVFAWILGAYAAGLIAVTIMVKASGTPGGPGLIDVATLVPAITFLAMWVMLGTAAGYRFGSPLVAPLATVGSFSVILVLYIVDYDLVRVGGASASLLGLAPYPLRQVAQTGLYLATGAWSVLWATRPAASASVVDGSRISSVVAGGLALALAAGLFFDNAPDFDQRPISFECTGSPPICLAQGYAQRPERVRAALAPLLAGLQEIGAPLPTAFRQENSNEDLVGTVPDDLALGDRAGVVSAVISAYQKSSCDTYAQPGLSERSSELYLWLDSLRPDPELEGGPRAEVFRTGTKEEQAAWLRDAIDRLRRCA